MGRKQTGRKQTARNRLTIEGPGPTATKPCRMCLQDNCGWCLATPSHPCPCPDRYGVHRLWKWWPAQLCHTCKYYYNPKRPHTCYRGKKYPVIICETCQTSHKEGGHVVPVPAGVAAGAVA